jgi:hypothetical protein
MILQIGSQRRLPAKLSQIKLKLSQRVGSECRRRFKAINLIQFSRVQNKFIDRGDPTCRTRVSRRGNCPWPCPLPAPRRAPRAWRLEFNIIFFLNRLGFWAGGNVKMGPFILEMA